MLDALAATRLTVRRRVDIFFRGRCKSVAVVATRASRPSPVAPEALRVIEEDGSWRGGARRWGAGPRSPGYLEICSKMGL